MSDLERSEPLHVATDVASITADLKKLDQSGRMPLGAICQVF